MACEGSKGATLAPMPHRSALPVRPFDDRVMRYVGPADENGCRNWTGSKARGYGKTNARLAPGGAYRTVRVARLIAHWVYGLDIDDRSWVARHICDNRACCEPSHLLFGTVKDNSQDMVRRGRSGRGRYRLDEEDVAEIRNLRKNGVPRRDVALQFGVHPEHITAICSHRFWK